MPLDYHKHVSLVADTDVRTVIPRDVQYQGSWQKRGGAGIFANLARKWDRIEAASQQHGYDIDKAFRADPGPTGLIDDIRDLRRYLLLTEAWLMQFCGLASNDNIMHRLGCPRIERGLEWRCTCRDDPAPPPADRTSRVGAIPIEPAIDRHTHPVQWLKAKLLEDIQLNSRKPMERLLQLACTINTEELGGQLPEPAIRKLLYDLYMEQGWELR